MAGPGSVIAAQMAVEDFGGAVLGRTIKIVVGDHRNKPDVGAALQRDTAKAVTDSGGTIVGVVKHPQGTTDFSSYLLQAQGAGAKLIAFANSGADQVNAIKQANEFGIPQSRVKLAGLDLHITDIHAIGLEVAQGSSSPRASIGT